MASWLHDCAESLCDHYTLVLHDNLRSCLARTRQWLLDIPYIQVESLGADLSHHVTCRTSGGGAVILLSWTEQPFA